MCPVENDLKPASVTLAAVAGHEVFSGIFRLWSLNRWYRDACLSVCVYYGRVSSMVKHTKMLNISVAREKKHAHIHANWSCS